MNLENIMLNERNQKKGHKLRFHFHELSRVGKYRDRKDQRFPGDGAGGLGGARGAGRVWGAVEMRSDC